MKCRDITIGPRELGASQAAPGEVWVQTRCSRHTRRPSHCDDRRAVVGAFDGYLRTYAFPYSLAEADSAVVLKALGLAGTEAERNRAIKLRQGLRKTNSLSRDLSSNRPEPEVAEEQPEEFQP